MPRFGGGITIVGLTSALATFAWVSTVWSLQVVSQCLATKKATTRGQESPRTLVYRFRSFFDLSFLFGLMVFLGQTNNCYSSTEDQTVASFSTANK
jgi:hypothetical protein